MGRVRGFVKEAWPYGALILLALLAYWPMFRNGFVWDDQHLILENHAIQGLWPPARFFQSQASTVYSLKGHRPVMIFSLTLDYAIWKLNPFGYHLTNFILHLLCMFGVAFLVQRLSRSTGAGFLAGALFALHPGHAEGVIAFEGRSDLLATLFVLVGLWGYRAHLSSGRWRRTLYYLGSLSAFLVACFCKESGLTLLGILVIYEGFVLGRSAGAWGWRALRLFPFLTIALFYWGYRGRVLGGQVVDAQWWGGSPGKNYLMAFEVYARYLRLVFFPLRLNPAYRVQVPGGFWDVRVLWGMALLLFTLGGTVWALSRHPKAGLLASWFVIGLIPVANIIPLPGVMVAERWLYLPSVGVCALGGWGAWILQGRARGWTRTVWTGVIAVVLVLFGIRTWLWSPAWKSEVSLAKAILSADPAYGLGHLDFAMTLWKQGRLPEAERELREAIRLKPNYAEAHNSLGALFGEQGRTEDEVSEYREAIRLYPDYAQAHYNLGVALGKQGKTGEAISEYREAIRLNPNDAGAHNNLGNALLEQGKLEQATLEFREALRVNPDYAEAHNNLGNALVAQEKTGEAMAEYREAVRLKPDNPDVHNNLGVLFGRQGDLEEAIAEFREAIRLSPVYAEAHSNLGNAYGKQGRIADATTEYRSAVRLKPDYAEAHYNLGVALGQQGKTEEAIAEYHEVLRINPDHAGALENLVAELDQQGKRKKAGDF